LLLKGREISLYKRLALALGTMCPNPDLVIYLDVEADVLLDRIRKRGRPYESYIDAEYLKSIDDAYGEYLSGLPSSKLLRINNSNLDISSAEIRKKLLSYLLSKVSAAQVIHDSANRRDFLSFG
jgi:deoxyadenosine/deoxycytidine kinase